MAYLVTAVSIGKTLPDGNHEALVATAERVPADPLLRLLWGQWKAHVVYLLGAHGPARFGVLRRRLEGVSPKVLTQRLRELEAAGILWREQEPTVPPKVTYGLTAMGRDVHGALTALDAPARRWLPGNEDDGPRQG